MSIAVLADADEMLARLDRELSQFSLAAVVERLLETAADECNQCDYNKDDPCEWCYYFEHDLDDPEEYAKEDATGGFFYNEFDIWGSDLEHQRSLYCYEMIEGLMKDFMGNDIYRGDIVAYAATNYHSARMTVAEYLEPADAGYVWVRPVKSSWGVPIGRKRHKVRTENMILLESK